MPVGLLGLGNVGSGVVKLVGENADAIAARIGERLSVRAIGVQTADKPRLVWPSPPTPSRYRSGVAPRQQRILLAANTESPGLWWYVDGALCARGGPAESLFVDPAPGAHRLVVMDAEGRSDALTYTVEE